MNTMIKSVLPFLMWMPLLMIVPLATASGQQPDEISYEDVSELPDGKTVDIIAQVIDLINSDEPKAIEQFYLNEVTSEGRDFAPMDAHIQYVRNFYRQSGGVDFHSIRRYNPPREDETVVILKGRNYEDWRAVVLQFDDAQDHKISSLRLGPARTPTNVTEHALTERELVAKVEATVDRLCRQGVYSGTVLLAKGDQVLYTNACGEASKRFEVPNDLETKFNIGSMNKMFTATAIMQLVEKGLISLDDPIDNWVDESWLPDSITSKVRVRHLLSHTSGLGSYFNERYDRSSRDLFRSLEDYKPLVRGDTLAFEPGERFGYSNTGMLLLGVVIQEVSGMDYFDYIREHIYKPTGMTNTDSYAMDEPVPNLAIGYIPDDSNPYGWKNNLYRHVLRGGPAGGGFSTMGDLHRFARALQQGKLVSKESLDQMWTLHTERYGYGFSVEQSPAGKVLGHSGGFSGLNGNLDIFLDKGYIVAVLSNHDRGASPMAAYVYGLIGRME